MQHSSVPGVATNDACFPQVSLPHLPATGNYIIQLLIVLQAELMKYACSTGLGLMVRFFLTFCNYRVNFINLSRRYWEGCICARILITIQAKKGRWCLQFFWQSQHWWAAEREGMNNEIMNPG